MLIRGDMTNIDSGFGFGFGYGSGNGYGSGFGCGSGYGYGDGSGYRSGCGYGNKKDICSSERKKPCFLLVQKFAKPGKVSGIEFLQMPIIGWREST
jgi:hypothetical protein